MDFDDAPEEAAFRAEARAWLEDNAPRRRDDGERSMALFAELPPDEEARQVARAKEWQRTKFDAGWAGVTWPNDYGGRGGTAMQSIIWGQEEGRFDVPAGVWAITMGMNAPTIIVNRTPAQ